MNANNTDIGSSENVTIILAEIIILILCMCSQTFPYVHLNMYM